MVTAAALGATASEAAARIARSFAPSGETRRQFRSRGALGVPPPRPVSSASGSFMIRRWLARTQTRAVSITHQACQLLAKQALPTLWMR